MWDKKEVHFAGDYMFEKAALATGTAAQESSAFELGCTEGGIRVHGWLEGNAACASGDNITSVLKVADSPDATAWKPIATNTVSATGTSLSGDLFSFIPDVDAKFMKVGVANSTGMTGAFSVAPELVP